MEEGRETAVADSVFDSGVSGTGYHYHCGVYY
jgi:hypothetical protein